MEQQDSNKNGKGASLIFRTVLPTAIILILIIAILSTMSTIFFNTAYNEVISRAEYEFDANIKTATDTLLSALKVNHQRYLDGYLSEEAALDNAKAIVRDTRYSSSKDMKDDGYFWADMADGLCVVHYNTANEGAMRWNSKDLEGNLFIQEFIKQGDAGGGYSEFYFGKPGDESGSYKKRGYTEKFAPYGWYISTGNYYDDMDLTVNRIESEKLRSLLILLGTSLVIAVAGVFFMLKSLKRIVVPIQTVSKQISRLSVGDTIEDFASGPERHDEIGHLQRSIRELSQATGAQAGVMQMIADGDYSVTVDVRSDRDVMSRAINNMLDSTNSTLSQINSAAGQVDSGAKQIAGGAQALAQGSTEQAASVQELSSSIADVSQKTKSNAEMANKAAALADTIKDNAEKGSRQMDEMINAVNDINAASGSIGKVIKVIDDIAFQTNILALNAAVEAARAGQHGKGFAVVAEEVRNLAAKSAEAAKETGAMIENSIEKANLGVHIAGETAASLTEIVNGIMESSQLVSEIAKSSEEQSMGIMQINTGIDQVAQVVQQNSATAEESAAASEEMSGQSGMLQQLISQFKLRDGSGRRALSQGSASAGSFALPPADSGGSSPTGFGFGKY
ncbi:MAG: methyl-accepting chemotaxis protein [Oscillospiraceae bacterium]|nr:methyl-accepting chemotaxis protein [Oscillospiraceae bacterium]